MEYNRLLGLLRYVVIAFALVVIVSGCEAPLPETPPKVLPKASEALPSAAEAFDAWKTLAEREPAHRDVEQAFTLTGAMAMEPGGLTPLVNYVGDDSIAGERRVFAVMCLSTQRDALTPYESQVVTWSGEGEPLETRKLATHVLGLMKSDSAMKTLTDRLGDSVRPVREAAVGVALTYHPELVTGQLMEFWNDPETTPAIRNQMVLGMPSHLVASYLPIYADAANDTRLAEPARLRAISVLGELGEPKHERILASCIEEAPEGTIREHARGALALLKASTGSETTAATE